MSSKVNEALFDLVHSMTKSEKRYFKLLSSRHTIGAENNYIRLFDSIDKQPVYNEEKLFDMFHGEAFLNRFSITKKRLYDHILSALDGFNIVHSVDAQLYKMLHSIDILYDKSLYDQSKRILRSAEKLARKHEKHEVLLLISCKKKKLIETSGYLKLNNIAVQEVHVNDVELAQHIECKNQLWAIKGKLFLHLSKKGIARSAEEVKTYSKICADILDVMEINPLSFVNKYLRNHVLSAYYYAIGNEKQSLHYLESNIVLFTSEASYPIEPNKQLSVYTNAIYMSDKLGDYKDAIRHLNQLKKMASEFETNEDLTIKLFSSITSVELNLHLRKGDFKTAYEISKSVESKLNEFNDKIVPIRRAFLAFKLAVIHMGMEDFSKALFWVNKILNDSRLDKTEDIIGYTQLLDLLIHIELNHNKLLPYSLKSTMRFFKTRNRLFEFEKVFLHFINKLIKCDDRFAIESLWQELYNELATLTDDSFENVAMEYFDFKSWAEAKLKNKSFHLILREKYNKTLKKAG